MALFLDVIEELGFRRESFITISTSGLEGVSHMQLHRRSNFFLLYSQLSLRELPFWHA